MNESLKLNSCSTSSFFVRRITFNPVSKSVFEVEFFGKFITYNK